MAASQVYNTIKIRSLSGSYTAIFDDNLLSNFIINPKAIYIIDERIKKIYFSKLKNLINNSRCIFIKATENNKTLEKIPKYIKDLVQLGVKRDNTLIAIGGGIIQDITCFLSSTLMRGIKWEFYPTTLLAQADSCIGSKSSINTKEIKNLMGTFNPPKKIIIDMNFLDTLSRSEILSGVGEMIKVHAIDSPRSFKNISKKYDLIFEDKKILKKLLYDSLNMKKKLIEIDEFDKGVRNKMNYGHSFGHAIESATNFLIPHGIAITIGMDIANFYAAAIGVSTQEHFERMHTTLAKNSSSYRHIKINSALLISALQNDKKNSSTQLRLILPNIHGKISIGLYDNDNALRNALNDYFDSFCEAA